MSAEAALSHLDGRRPVGQTTPIPSVQRGPIASLRTRGGAAELYLPFAPDPVLVHLHLPAELASPSAGVVICPAFGWDELCSYRSRRWLADALAGAGLAAVRIDFPGSGDSGGHPQDPGRFGAWVAAVDGTAEWLRTELGCARTAAFGIGLGGVVACRAMLDGAPLDDLALWAVPARGRMLLRELRTFATVAATDYADNGPPGYSPLGSGRGGLEVAGFAISDETAAAIEQLDLAAMPLPPSRGRRVMLLGRDGIDPDERLRARFADSGVEVTVAPGRGYAEMMTHPQFARTPREELGRVVSWFERAPAEVSDASRRPRVSVTALQSAELKAGGIPILERPLAFEHAGIALRGVLTEPRPTLAAAPQTCAVLLSAGAIRRIGPNRIWVETARRWAARGIPTVRLDVEGVGDADGDESRYLDTAQFYRPELTEQVLAALDGIVAQGLPARFVLGGLCSGAYWALHAALADQRVVGLQLVNLHSFFWNELDVSSRNLRLAGAYLRERRWREMVRIAASERRIARTVRAQLRGAIDPSAWNARKRGGDRVDRALDELRDRGVETLLLFSEGEPLEDSLWRTGRLERLPSWPNLRLERIPIKDHTFRAAWAQRRASEILDAALARSLAGS